MKVSWWMWSVAVWLGACGGWTSEPKRASPAGTPLEQARAYERGVGVARDYHAAAEIYRVACDNGRGHMTACQGDAAARQRAASHGVKVADCHVFDPPVELDPVAQDIAATSAFKDRMCACVDKGCADRVTEEMTRWHQAEAKP